MSYVSFLKQSSVQILDESLKIKL